MESIVRDQIMRHMRDNKLFTVKQYGFLDGRSTVLQLLVVLDTWTKIIDEGGTIDCVYYDFKKAFDKFHIHNCSGKWRAMVSKE